MNDSPSFSFFQDKAYTVGEFRYSLFRPWNPGIRGVTFVMLNPSTANGLLNDPTVRRVMQFARDWAYGSVSVVNLYAFRATDPSALRRTKDIVGPDFWPHFRGACSGADVVAAWGSDVGPNYEHARRVVDYLVTATTRLDALGFCANGQPRHPLYVRRSAERIDARELLRGWVKKGSA